MEDDFRKEINKSYRTTLMVCVAMVLATGLYVAMVEIFRAGAGRLGINMLGDTMSEVVKWLCVAVSIGAVFVVQRVKSSYWAKAMKAYRAQPENVPVLTYMSSLTIMAFAVYETPAILGMIYYLLSGQSLFFYILLLISFVGFVLNFPRKNRWIRDLDGI